MVYFHTGIERSTCPSSRTKILFQRAKDAGAKIIVGSHPHVLGPYKFSNGVLEAYSLGNFIFYASNIKERKSLILQVEVRDNEVKNINSIDGIINPKTGVWEEKEYKKEEPECKV